jgi:hypothetical protein
MFGMLFYKGIILFQEKDIRNKNAAGNQSTVYNAAEGTR